MASPNLIVNSTTLPRIERRTEERKKAKIIRKFQNGDITPNEFYRKHGFPHGATCQGCGAPPAVKAIVLADFKEAVKRGMVPALGLDGQLNEAVAKTIVQLRGPDGRAVPHTRLSMAYACSNCRPTFEKVLAKAPSWCIVEIHEGPNPRNRVQIGYDS